MPEFA